MSKKNLILFLLFVGLIGVSLFVLVKSRPTAGNLNPFEPKDIEAITKLEISRGEKSVSLEKKSNRWEITAPYSDWAEEDALERLLDILTRVKIGSLISSNKDKYDEFKIKEDQGIHLIVYRKGEEKPVWDGWIGKSAGGISNSYFRFSNKDPVYIAQELPVYQFQPHPAGYRQRTLFGSFMDRVTRLEFLYQGRNSALAKANDGWAESLETLIDTLKRLRSNEFESEKIDENVLGFNQPHFVITAKNDETSKILKFGHIQVKDNAATKFRYARLEGRPTTLLVEVERVEKIISFIKPLVVE